MVKANMYMTNDSHFALKMEGHAEYKKNVTDNDIVCSAASILAYTFEYSMEKLGLIVKPVKEEPGDYYCTCHLEDKSKTREAKAIFDTVYNGLELLQHNYPKNVQVNIINTP